MPRSFQAAANAAKLVTTPVLLPPPLPLATVVDFVSTVIVVPVIIVVSLAFAVAAFN
jgi:hypothetical protein